ncbi:MAG: tyrosine-type recombinase/integrase [Micromonosporaceae bacterium]
MAALSTNTDYHEWKSLLAEAGLRDTRLHDARHTAATVPLILGVPTPTAMALMGWSSTAMAKLYQHLIDVIRRHVAKQVGGLPWDTDDARPDDRDTATRKRPAESDQRANETTQLAGPGGMHDWPGVLPGKSGGGCEIRTREGLHPTRFPTLWASVHHCPATVRDVRKHAHCGRW